MRRLRIGYFGHSPDLQGAGDRRRLVHWARRRGHSIFPQMYKDVDLVVFTLNSSVEPIDIGCPTVLDLVDAYSIRNSRLEDFLRRNLKTIDQRSWNFGLSYVKLVKQFASKANLTIASSQEQLTLIRDCSSNAVAILDFHEEFPNLPPSSLDLTWGKCLWEGGTATLNSLLRLLNSEARDTLALDFRIVTDTFSPHLLGKYLKTSTNFIIKQSTRKSIHNIGSLPWSVKNVVDSAKVSCMSVVPVDIYNKIAFYKPENRIAISWRLGLPVLASKTPSHLRLESEVGVDFTFHDANTFYEKIAQYKKDFSELRHQINMGKAYLSRYHNEDVLLEKWDRAIGSVV